MGNSWVVSKIDTSGAPPESEGLLLSTFCNKCTVGLYPARRISHPPLRWGATLQKRICTTLAILFRGRLSMRGHVILPGRLWTFFSCRVIRVNSDRHQTKADSFLTRWILFPLPLALIAMRRIERRSAIPVMRGPSGAHDRFHIVRG